MKGVTIHALDVRDDASALALAKSLGEKGIDLLVNNAGIASPWESATQLIALFGRLGMESSGKYFGRKGEPFP